MSNAEWVGQGRKVNDTGCMIRIDGVVLGQCEVAINIMWYEKIDVNSDVIEYHVTRAGTHLVIQCNKYMLYGFF